jgi:hypothetical protein
VASLSTSTYKRYNTTFNSDIEYQLNENILKSELSKPPESFSTQFVESEKASPNTTLNESELTKLLAIEFKLQKLEHIFIKYIDDYEDLNASAEAIVYSGDQEILIA